MKYSFWDADIAFMLLWLGVLCLWTVDLTFLYIHFSHPLTSQIFVMYCGAVVLPCGAATAYWDYTFEAPPGNLGNEVRA